MRLRSSQAAAAIFLGSFLLFGVQPMLGRTLLPSFGGTAAVWTACLAAYQLLLLAGYAYAHGVSKLSLRTQRRLHGGLLLLAVCWTLGFAFLRVRLCGRLGAGAVPGLEVVFAVTVIVGLPYVLLASGSTLLQAWLARSGAGREVYGLYAISNLGSLLGLLAYPLVLEPHVAVGHQWIGFAAAFGCYALLLGWVGHPQDPQAGDCLREVVKKAQHPPCNPTRKHGTACGKWLKKLLLRRSALFNHTLRAVPCPQACLQASPQTALPAALSRPWLWWALPALSSFLLVAATNHLTLDVTPVPLLWAVVLGLFLLSYVVGFSKPGERLLPLWMVLASGSVAVLVVLTIGAAEESGPSVFWRTVRWGLPSLFLVLTFVHAWLHAARPEGCWLTRYYLGIAGGGAIGGTAAGLGAPVLLRTVAEYPAALLLSAVAVAGFVWTLWHPRLRGGLNQLALLACAAVPVVLFQARGKGVVPKVLWQDRGFYGTVTVQGGVEHRREGDVTVHTFLHGRTRHGVQPQRPGSSWQPTTYYSRNGGGVALESHPKYKAGEAVRVGGVGLGVGVMAAYGRPGDTYRFHEISPEVVNIATNPAYFTFLSECRAKVELVEGDARKELERERDAGEPGYDVLVVDAYSGDSIPVHLATDEAFDLYRSRLAPGGILALHISNWQFDLYPLCKQQMERMGMFGVGLIGVERAAEWVDESGWVFLAEAPFDPVFPERDAKRVDWSRVPLRTTRTITDERGSILPYIQRFAPKPASRPLPQARPAGTGLPAGSG